MGQYMLHTPSQRYHLSPKSLPLINSSELTYFSGMSLLLAEKVNSITSFGKH